jgi:hypothetical protein
MPIKLIIHNVLISIYVFILLLLLSLFAMLGIESRTSHVLGKCSTTELHPLPPFEYFHKGSLKMSPGDNEHWMASEF